MQGNPNTQTEKDCLEPATEQASSTELSLLVIPILGSLFTVQNSMLILPLLTPGMMAYIQIPKS